MHDRYNLIYLRYFIGPNRYYILLIHFYMLYPLNNLVIKQLGVYCPPIEYENCPNT